MELARGVGPDARSRGGNLVYRNDDVRIVAVLGRSRLQADIAVFKVKISGGLPQSGNHP
jgi:hypothetical protein